VTVGGRRAASSGGSVRATVPLAAGTNVVDVLASAGSARPALTAIRVRRVIAVTVPDLSGLSIRDARRRLGDLRLGAKVDEQGGIFDRLFGGDPLVCSTDPPAGEDADPGDTVTLLVSRRC
jgi:beta-lactam-binding protein with PASTA domain